MNQGHLISSDRVSDFEPKPNHTGNEAVEQSETSVKNDMLATVASSVAAPVEESSSYGYDVTTPQSTKFGGIIFSLFPAAS